MRYLKPALIGAFCIGSVVVLLKWLLRLTLGSIDAFNGGAAAHGLRLSPIQFMGEMS
jgi:hypothetical protein